MCSREDQKLEDKVDRVLNETEKNRQMVSQILATTFKSQSSDQRVLYHGPKVIMENFRWRFTDTFRTQSDQYITSNNKRPSYILPITKYYQDSSPYLILFLYLQLIKWFSTYIYYDKRLAKYGPCSSPNPPSLMTRKNKTPSFNKA